MSVRSLQSVHAEAQRLFQEGRLEQCREATENLLLDITQSSAPAPSTASPATHVKHSGGRPGSSPSSAFAPAAEAEAAAVRHALFANGLLLLSSCYSAVGSDVEAERLLATCQGYIEEHQSDFSPPPSSCLSAAAAATAGNARVNQALAAIAYSRGAIRLERYRTDAATPVSVVEEADSVFLAEAERRLQDVLGVERLLLADVWHCRGVCCELLAGSAVPSTSTAFPPYVRALSFYAKSMDVRRRHTDAAGVTELKLALTLEHVAHLLRLSAGPAEQGRKDEALRVLETVAETRRRLLGPQHPLLASTLVAVGAVSVEVGRYARARAAFTTALEIVQRVFPEDDVRVAEVQYWLSRVA